VRADSRGSFFAQNFRGGALTGIGKCRERRAASPARSEADFEITTPNHTTRFVSCDARSSKKSRGFSLARRRCCSAVQCRVLQPVVGAPRQRWHLKRARSTDIEAAADPAGSLELWSHLASGDMLPRVRFLRGPTSPEDGDPTSPDSWNQPTTIKSCMSSCSTTSENRRWPEADSSKYTAPITSLVYSVVCCGLVGEG